MEFILIGESTLKVTLTAEDLEDFDICADELDYGNTETKRMLWDILGRAKKRVGFMCDNSKIIVRLFPSSDGGCELFVTRADNTESTDKAKKEGKTALVKRAYYFEELEHLLSVCRRLFALGYSGESSAYICEEGGFYLFIETHDRENEYSLDEFSFITEYGRCDSEGGALRRLSEYGRLICQGAVNRLSSL